MEALVPQRRGRGGGVLELTRLSLGLRSLCLTRKNVEVIDTDGNHPRDIPPKSLVRASCASPSAHLSGTRGHKPGNEQTWGFRCLFCDREPSPPKVTPTQKGWRLSERSGENSARILLGNGSYKESEQKTSLQGFNKVRILVEFGFYRESHFECLKPI